MILLNIEKERIFCRLVRKGPHILEFSDDYLMVHNGRIALAPPDIVEEHHAAKEAGNEDRRRELTKKISESINEVYYKNSDIQWYSLREYINNFNTSRLRELVAKAL